ncbi:hypothetical protein E1B28_011050 [Marasmius oreades]|uniref:CCHC-type domain-containing protein n=1 Tax=Marasmius oreades TaxID=181124 RepID=A0A9P7UPT6_9AGAR|nr:uncharacterized protein E1B28_011050 [Marasmius oreades]KAG7089360.1 hypothetical protein E1B28_011050 [Marasmius oreades]
MFDGVYAVALPPLYSREAPAQFRGSYAKVEDFIKHFERLLVKYGINDEREQCEGILEYCSTKVRRTIQSLTAYQLGSWKKLKKEILRLYDADRAQNRYQPSDIQALALRQAAHPIDNLSQWLKYVRRFQERGGILVQTGRMTVQIYATYFWLGIPQRLKGILELTLHAKKPLRDVSEPYPVEEVCEAAEHFFKRSRFVSMVPDAGAFGTQQQEEDSGEDSESESESESDEEDYEKWRKKFKERRKKKSRTKSKDIKNSYPAPTVPMAPAEVSRTTQFSGPQSEVADLITRLNSMQLDHPEYGTLYYRATTMDPHSKNCINKIPGPQFIPNNRPLNSYSGGQGNRPPNNFSRDGRGMGVNSYEQRPPLNSSFTCFGCGNPKHRITECPLVTERITKQEIKWCPDRRKYVLFDGTDLGRHSPGETLIQAIEQNIREKESRTSPSPNQAMLLTISDAVQNFYAQQGSSQTNDRDEVEYETATETSEDGSSGKSADESDGYSGMWGESESELSEISKDEDSSLTYDTNLAQANVHLGADHTKTTSRSSRNHVQQGPRDDARELRAKRAVHPPRRADGTTPTWQESVGVHKRSPRAGTVKGNEPERISGKIPEVKERIGNKAPNMPPDRNKMDTRPDNSAAVEPAPPTAQILPNPAAENLTHGHPPSFLPSHPLPFDARLPSKRRAVSLEPELLVQGKTIPHMSSRPPTQQRVKINTPEITKVSPEPTRIRRERKTDLARRVDTREIVSQLLGTTIQMPLGDMLGVSKEVSSIFHELTKVKVPRATKTSKTVLAQVNSRPHTATYLTHNAQLIEILLEFEGNHIRAIIDTGSMINVISSRTYEAAIRLPIDLGRQTVMHDANGGEGVLRGAIDGLRLLCSSVQTVGFFYVGESVPFEMLLGRPWLRENAVSIDERRNGTYLVFKDRESWEPRFEMLASTILGQCPQFRLAGRVKGATIRAYLARFVSSRVPDCRESRSDSKIEELPETEAEDNNDDEINTMATYGTQLQSGEGEIQQRQPFYDGFDIPFSQPRLRSARWTPPLSQINQIGHNDGTVRTLEERNTIQEPPDDVTSQDLHNPSPIRSLVHSVSPEIKDSDSPPTPFKLLLQVWLEIVLTASALLLAWLDQRMEVLCPEHETDKRGSSSTPPDSPHHNSVFYSMPPRTRSQTKRLFGEAGPLASQLPVGPPQPTHPPPPIPQSTPSPKLPPPPIGLVDPGPIDKTVAALREVTTSAAIRDICEDAARRYRQTGLIHTRPFVLSTAQAYLIAAEPTANGGFRQEMVLLNTGAMLYNPEKKDNSFQLGHAYVRFYPNVAPLPIAPKAVLAQHLVYTYKERQPTDPAVARVELASGTHSLKASDFKTAGPFQVDPSSLEKECNGKSRLSSEGHSRHLKSVYVAIVAEATDSDEPPELIDVDEVKSDVDEVKMDVDDAELDNSKANMDIAVPDTSSKLPIRSRTIRPPSPTSSTVSNCGSDTTMELQYPSAPTPPALPAADPSSLRVKPANTTGIPTPFFDSRLTPRTRILPSALLSVGELERLIERPAVGCPIFIELDPIPEVDFGKLTSIFQVQNHAIVCEHPRESHGRLQQAYRALFDEFQYQMIEEKAEHFYDAGETPSEANRQAVAKHFEHSEVCRQLTNRFRFRQFMSHTIPSQPLMEQEEFSQENWLEENEFGGISVGEAGRWKYRKLIALSLDRQLYRAMRFTTEYFLLRKVDHLFRARYFAYVTYPNALERYQHFHDNRFLNTEQRRWLITAWEIFIHLQDVEISALVQFSLRMKYRDSEALDTLHQKGLMPKFPTILPGIVSRTWNETLSCQEDVGTFNAHVALPASTPKLDHSSPNPRIPFRLPRTLAPLLNPPSDIFSAPNPSSKAAVL